MKLIPIEEVKLEGVGEKGLDKLIKGGVTTIQALAIMTPMEVVSHVGGTVKAAEKMVQQARDILGAGFITVDQLVENRESETFDSTGSPSLDRILGGGIRPGTITEIIGGFGSLKTQTMITAATVKASKGETVLVIDTEGTWVEGGTERIKQIAITRGLDVDIVTSNMRIARAYNADHLLQLIEELPKLVNDFNAKMVILDSIISHFRGEYKGLGNLAERQKDLGTVIHMLTRVASGFRIPVLVTNQVQTNIGVVFGDANQPAGGNIMGHGGTYRVMFRKGRMNKGTSADYQTSVASILDSSHLAPLKVRIMATEAGVIDEDGSYDETDEEDELEQTE